MIQFRSGDAVRGEALLRHQAAATTTSTEVSHVRPDAGRPGHAGRGNRLRAIDQAIFTLNSHGQVTSWNTGAERILGWTAVTILGRDSAVLYPPAEHDPGGLAAEMQAAAATGQVDSEHWMLRRDGTRFWAAQTLTPLLGKDGEERGFLKILRDCTGRRLAAAARARSGARLRQLNKALQAEVAHYAEECGRVWQLNPDLLMLARPDGTLVAVNPAWSALLGWTEQELVGSLALHLVHPDDRVVTLAEMERLAAGLTALRFVNRCRHQDGSWRWLSWTAVAGGGLIQATGRDVTAERAASGALHVAQEQLHQSQKMETMGQLTGGVAHDFNNLLQGLGNNLDMAQLRLQQGRAADAGRYVDTAHKGVDRAAALTVRLLAFARREQLQPCLVDPVALISGLSELIERTMGSTIKVELHPGGDAWPVLCDPSRLESAVLNLAINARDAMPEGGRLTIGTRRVQLTDADVAGQDGAVAGDYVEIAATDTGTGMASEVLARAFEPFFTTKLAGQGTGLGLSQLQSFVRQSGGVVQLDSTPGQGTTVRVCLPRHV